jgi:hypothetical protein
MNSGSTIRCYFLHCAFVFLSDDTGRPETSDTSQRLKCENPFSRLLVDFRGDMSDPGCMKLFAQMLACVLVGLCIGSAISWERHSAKLLEVRVVETRDQSSMRFAGNSLPHTIVEHRSPIKQWAVSGILGDVGEIVYELPPAD